MEEKERAGRYWRKENFRQGNSKFKEKPMADVPEAERARLGVQRR